MEEPGRLQFRGCKQSHTTEQLNFHFSSSVDITQSCPTLCNPTAYTVHGILQARILEWVALPSPRDLPYPGVEPRSPTLQADSLPAEPPGKSKNIGVGKPIPSPVDLPNQELNWDLLHCRWILHQMNYQGSPKGGQGNGKRSRGTWKMEKRKRLAQSCSTQ